jgi:hypothetical protein
MLASTAVGPLDRRRVVRLFQGEHPPFPWPCNFWKRVSLGHTLLGSLPTLGTLLSHLTLFHSNKLSHFTLFSLSIKFIF